MAAAQDSAGDGSSAREGATVLPRHVVVDGSNLATEGRSLPSLAQLDEAVRAYRSERPDEEIIVVVDASFGYRIDESERAIFEEAEEAGEIVSPPAGAIGRGDKFLLQIADRIDAVVLSNDSFQEFHGEYGWLFDEGRLIGGKPVPAVGWIFTARTPVRGPRSRVAVRDAQQKRRTRSEPVRAAIAEATVEAVLPPDEKQGRRRGRRRTTSGPTEAINDPLPFITFIADHPLGSEVEGEVDAFTSHGAFVLAAGARCYAPVSGLADPPPRSAKEMLSRGEVRTFVVQALDAPRRGIELALPGLARVAGAPTAETVEAEIDVGSPRRRRRPDRVRSEAEPGAQDGRPETEMPVPDPITDDEPAGGRAPAKRTARRRSSTPAVPEPQPPVEEEPDIPTAVPRSRRAVGRRSPAKSAPTRARSVAADAAPIGAAPGRRRRAAAGTAPVSMTDQDGALSTEAASPIDAAPSTAGRTVPAARKAATRRVAKSPASAGSAVTESAAEEAAAPRKASGRRPAAKKAVPEAMADGAEGPAAAAPAPRKRPTTRAATAAGMGTGTTVADAPGKEPVVRKAPVPRKAVTKTALPKKAVPKTALPKTLPKKAATKKAVTKKAATTKPVGGKAVAVNQAGVRGAKKAVVVSMAADEAPVKEGVAASAPARRRKAAPRKSATKAGTAPITLPG